MCSRASVSQRIGMPNIPLSDKRPGEGGTQTFIDGIILNLEFKCQVEKLSSLFVEKASRVEFDCCGKFKDLFGPPTQIGNPNTRDCEIVSK